MRNIIKKLIPYLLVLIIVFSFFSFTKNVEAAGTCWNTASDKPVIGVTSADKCTGPGQKWIESTTPTAAPVVRSQFENEYDTTTQCAVSWNEGFFNVPGCLITVSYYVFYALPAFLLGLAAKFFNALIAVSVSSTLTIKATFISTAWTVVRDLSNIFFILVLLYVAAQTILGVGGGGHGGGPKKMIAQVVIMALLINFSMFFTKVVIDSSNILALVFYSKLTVVTTKNGTPINYTGATGPDEKDIAGSMVSSFNPTSALTWDNFLKQARTYSIPDVAGGKVQVQARMPAATMFALILISGAIMLFATYAFFIAGLSFVGRLIELWILIIFSPFAFMSSTLPILGHIPDVGWDSWLKKLFSVAFMAPIFMFFMYFIFLLLRAPLFKDIVTDQNDILSSLLMILIPALIILTLLLRATDYAKKGAGKVGEAVISTVKTAAALGIGGAALGGALALRSSVGAFMKGASTGDSLNQRFKDKNQRADMKFSEKILGGLMHYGTLGGLSKAQEVVGKRVNKDQQDVLHAAHARHELDSMASTITHGKIKEWDKLGGMQRYEARRQLARERVVRENSGTTLAAPGSFGYVPGLTAALGTRKWEALAQWEKDAIDASANVGDDGHGNPLPHGDLAKRKTKDDDNIRDARRKQGLVSKIVQSSVGGTFDVRNLANVVMKEQSSLMAKAMMGLTGALAMGLRGGFKQMGVNYGTAQGAFFKDLADTIGESLKSLKVNVDLSHVGDEKKEGHGGGGGHH
jgi:hypothetical protein